MLSAATDERGNVTTTAYDSTFRMLPVSVRTPAVPSATAGFLTTTSYDLQCQKPLVVTDPNGETTTFTYDDLCRERTRITSAGGYLSTQYFAIGDPATQAIFTLDRGANGAAIPRESAIWM